MNGIIYLLTNPSIPDLVKIGRTKNLEERMRSLSSHSGVPVPFECFYACEVADAVEVEKRVHDAFADHRVNPKREYFRINPERVMSILELLEIREDVTPSDDVVEDQSDQDALDRERKIRSRFKFSMVGVPHGSILTFARDETITATVLDNTQVEFEGEATSLTGSAIGVLRRTHPECGARNGSMYWVFEGETLWERRLRMENE